MLRSKHINFFKNQTILVTGGAGFLGSYVVKEIIKQGGKKSNIIIPRSKDIDLRYRQNCRKITRNVDLVFHLAGNVGGIGKNLQMPGTLFYDNLIMGVELMEAARLNKVKKIVTIGTVCSYPKITKTPFQEKDLWNGYPEETNAPYGLAKKMLLVQSMAYRKQYSFNSINLILVNLYGIGDKFDDNTSHVIPALIKKIFKAKQNKEKYIEVWGDGSATREFLYVEDGARGIVLAGMHYQKSDPVNIGSGQEISIKNLANLICQIIGYQGRIKWDKAKPNGQPKRLLDISLAKKEFGFSAKVSFKKGLQKTINWYRRDIHDTSNN